MSPYPQKPTFPVDLRPGRYSTVKRSGTSLVVDVDPTPLLAVDGPFGDEIEKRIPQLTRYGALLGSGDAAVAFRSALASWMAGGERRVDVSGRNFTVSNGDGTANRGQYQACLLFQGTGTEEIAPHFRGTSLTMASGLPNSFATHVVVKNMKRFAPTGDLTLDWARLTALVDSDGRITARSDERYAMLTNRLESLERDRDRLPKLEERFGRIEEKMTMMIELLRETRAERATKR